MNLDRFDTFINGWAATLGWPAEAVFQLFLAAVMGGLVGMEREFRGRVAGFRTNLLVCLGSALTMIVSRYFAIHPWEAQTPNLGVNINVDPARIAYGVMTGVGFLGAGAIVRGAGTVRGLTTAAAMWCVAAMGMAAGFGMYSVCMVATVMVMGALWLLNYIEDLLPKVRYRTVVIRRVWHMNCLVETIQRFKSAGLDVIDASFQREGDLSNVDISLSIAFINKHQYYTFERQLEKDKDFLLISAREV